MSPVDSLDATALTGVDVLIFAAKATRFLSRGSEVSLTVAGADDERELRAWARWAGHGSRPGEHEREVVLLVRALR